MNILLFFSSTGIGGTETNFLKIGKELSLLNHTISVAALKNEGPLLRYFEPFTKTQKLIGPASRPFKVFSSLANIIKEDKIEVVFNFGLKVEIYSRLASKLFGAKYIISNIRSTDDWRKPYHTLLDKITANQTDIWISNSQDAKQVFIEREKLDPQKVKVIYNYIEPITGFPSAKPIDKQNYKIGILSNIKKGKGFEDLIPLSKMLIQSGIHHTFIISGQDRLHGSFQEKLKKTGIEDKFVFTGYIEDKSQFFNNIDTFLLPTYFEGLPTSILESMAYKTPVVSTTVGGIPELITNNVNGLLCEPGDIKGLHDALITAMDETKRNLWINESLLKIESQFSKKMVFEKWVNLINSLQ